MTDIQFNEPEYTSRPAPAPKRSYLSNLVIKSGLARDDAGAQKALLVIFCIVVALIVGINWPSDFSTTEVPAEEYPGMGTPGI